MQIKEKINIIYKKKYIMKQEVAMKQLRIIFLLLILIVIIVGIIGICKKEEKAEKKDVKNLIATVTM